MSKPLKPSDVWPRFHAQFLSKSDLKILLSEGNILAKDAFFQIWMTEGVPYVFKDEPTAYYLARDFLAKRINVAANRVTLIGSSRTGFKFGQGAEFLLPFDDKSDLDFTAICPGLFERLKKDAENWASAYEMGSVLPRNPTEGVYWDRNLKVVPHQLSRGFIDPRFLPNRNDVCPEVSRVNNSLYLLSRYLDSIHTGLGVRKTSIRVYFEWGEFRKQVLMNLSKLAIQ